MRLDSYRFSFIDEQEVVTVHCEEENHLTEQVMIASACMCTCRYLINRYGQLIIVFLGNEKDRAVIKVSRDTDWSTDTPGDTDKDHRRTAGPTTR